MNWKKLISLYRNVLPLMSALLLSSFLFAQSDSLGIALAQLSYQDIDASNQLQLGNKVTSASRSLQDVKDLPFPTYVITGDEIRRMGYITLVDAIKHLPGIRVSQPGSAIEGETFMMRGLLGNTYAKILVNGQPVKPFVVSGMPIGAQLPIQLAERIEVIYGPAAALYGADASAGIINIVTEKSERPIFTKASLHLGSKGYTGLNLMLGGKMGLDENIIKFRLIGSNTSFNDRKIFYNRDSIYNTAHYLEHLNLQPSFVTDNANYRGTPTAPLINETPHLSRSFGMELDYRIFSFSFKNMYRRDHSSIGLTPLAVSYSNPLNFTGETIIESNLVAKKQYEKFGFETTVSYLKYEMDTRSSTTYVSPFIDVLFNALSQNLPNIDSLHDVVHNTFVGRTRFSGANSVEYAVEQTLNFKLGDVGDFTSGFKFLRAHGQPFTDFQRAPLGTGDFEVDNVVPIFDHPEYNEFNAFGQVFLTLKKFNILLGGQYFIRRNPDFFGEISSFNPRLAILYKARDNFRLRASYSSAFRLPSPYFNATTYTLSENSFDKILAGSPSLSSEETTSYEMGWLLNVKDKLEWDLGLYYSQTKNFIGFNLRVPQNLPNQAITIGYFNDESSKASLVGIQSLLLVRDIIPSIKLDARLSLHYARSTESFIGLNILELETSNSDINGLRAYPNFIGHLRFDLNPWRKLSLTFDNVLLSKSNSRNVVAIENSFLADDDSGHIIAGYYTLDIISSYRFSNNFLLYARISNVFNQKYGGIDANYSPDVLFINPQSLITFRIGVNYDLK